MGDCLYMKNIKEELNIEEFDFSSRVLWVLARNNINKERLTAMSYDELKAIPTMGAEKISEIKRELELKGFNNIVVPNLSSESKDVRQQHKDLLLDEIINYLLTNSSLNIEDNKMDAFIIEELKQHFSDLNTKGLELKMKKINKIKFHV